jgi:hypothetical protein
MPETNYRAALAQPEPQGPTDEDLYDLAEVFNGEPVAAMRRALELWGTPTAQPGDDEIDEEAETVIPWLLEMAVQAANRDRPYAAGRLTLAAQLLGERRPTNNTREEN